MFDLAAKRLVWIPVKWPGVTAEADDQVAGNTTFEIELQVEILDSDALKAVLGTESQLDNLARFKALAHDWRGVKLGKISAPMTDENVAAMLRVPMFASGFETSYLAAWAGRMEARQGNSQGSSADGLAVEQPEKPTS